MKHYAYRVYKNGQLNQPKFGGTVSATSMDDAVKEVIKRLNIEVITEGKFTLQPESKFYLDGEKVGILIYANPEDYIETFLNLWKQ